MEYRYNLETRSGIWAIVDTKCESFEQRGNGLHADDEFVMCSWHGVYHELLACYEVQIEKRIEAKRMLKVIHRIEEATK